jgi:hypothetical protein
MAVGQFTGAKNAKISAATQFATPRITFLAALACASVAPPARNSIASSSTPAAAPK